MAAVALVLFHAVSMLVANTRSFSCERIIQKIGQRCLVPRQNLHCCIAFEGPEVERAITGEVFES